MRTEFLLSAARADQLPELDLPEFAFMGRSNVGKSSLLNALVRSRIARTSSTPGRTQQINLFRVHAGFGDFALADLPGYGYAKVPKAVRASWAPLVDRYLRRRALLTTVFLLVDVRRDPAGEDRAAVEAVRAALSGARAELVLVATKLDKFPKAKRKPRLAAVARGLGVDPASPIATSASAGLGLDQLLRHIETRARAP